MKPPFVVLFGLTVTAACGSASPTPPAPPSDPPVVAAPADPAPPHASTEPPAPPAVETVTSVTVPPELRAAVAAPDRDAADRDLDAGRQPAETLAFFEIGWGERVAELGAGMGYTAELLARAVGPGGKVFAQNSKLILERFAEKPWSERLKKPVMAPVSRVDREFADPLPPEAIDLDAVINILFYHDTVWMKVDRAAMNEAVFRALKPGGVYGIVDHDAREGAGTTDAETLHRIEKKALIDEVTSVGFVLAAQATFLESPNDTRDWNASPRAAGEKRGTSDRFVLRFVKPTK
jgi:predicted methyltransferase